MSAPQFSVKRRFISGQNDWRYQDTKASVTTSEDQFIFGVKQFADPIKALGDVLCSGSYYGDGSHLTGVTSSDPTKLPLTGGTLTGSLTVNAPGLISGNGSGLTGITPSTLDEVLAQGNTSTNQLILTNGADLFNTVSQTGVNVADSNSSATMAVSVFNVTSLISNRFSYLTHGALYFDDALYTGQPFEMGGDSANSPRFHFYSQGGGRGRFSVENPNNPDISLIMSNELGDDRMGVVNNGTQASVYMTPSNLFVSDGVGTSAVLGNYQMYFQNSSGNHIEINNDALQQWILLNNTAMTANYLAGECNFYENSSGTTVMTYRHNEMITKNAASDFAFRSEANRFYKWKAAQSFTVDRNETHVERWHSFKVSEGGSPFNFNAFNDYLDTDGKDGWSVILSNSDGSDILVNSPDISFYGHAFGVQSGSMALKKWATARFTLVELPSYPSGYAWAVSMY